MAKLTDEFVARAIGWTERQVHGKTVFYPPKHRKRDYALYLHSYPEFTTSIDALMGELKARKIWWKLDVYSDGINKPVATLDGGPVSHSAKTAPLALCHALLAYLEANA